MQLRMGGRAGAAVLMVLVMLVAMAVTDLSAPSTARADSTEQSILMDDYAFIYSDPAEVKQNLAQVAALGVNTIKVSVVWSLVAPDPQASTAPSGFDASDPAAYPSGNWQRYDTLVQEAGQLGLKVYFQITGPAPNWATNPQTTNALQNGWSHDLDAADFGQFVAAVGERYSGSYPVAGDGDTETTGATTSTTTTSPTSPAAAIADAVGRTTSSDSATSPQGTTTTGSGSASASDTLPAVTEWGLWNEPNEVGWISPQTEQVDHHSVAVSPVTYRQMFDLGYRALVNSGHSHDTILLGETASKGTVHELTFIQDLFCVDAENRPLRGAAARDEDCPSSPSAFVQQNPGLFRASGYATHPYSFSAAPDTVFTHAPGTITMANLSEIGSTLDAIDAHYHEQDGMPIYVTEWGYKTNPPNPTITTTLSEQETWLDEGWYMSYFMPRVKSMAQELLYDQPPVDGTVPGTAAYWDNFDSGLEYSDGDPKPAYAAFRLPLWLPSPTVGTHVPVWAEIRPAVVADNATAQLEFEAKGSSTWAPLALVSSDNPEGFIDTTISIPRPGSVRLAWGDPVTQTIDYSRTVAISPAPRPLPRRRPRHRAPSRR